MSTPEELRRLHEILDRPLPDDQVPGDTLNVSLRLSPAQMGQAFVGRTANELIAMGFTVPEDIPGNCVLKADGSFEFITMSFTLKPKDQSPEEIARCHEELRLTAELIALVAPDCKSCGGKGYQGTIDYPKYLEMCECIIRNDPDYPFKGVRHPERTTPMQPGEAELREQLNQELFG